ncbi:hypothetical protein TNCV_4455501 [Trichonephila clavipes]|nr:hypothetical protein TNCV_4455501 [Trichonephila clavipes]
MVISCCAPDGTALDEGEVFGPEFFLISLKCGRFQVGRGMLEVFELLDRGDAIAEYGGIVGKEADGD